VPVAVTTSGVLSGKILVQVAVGSGSACALDSTGAAYCWGSDASGQLGNNSTTQAAVPVAVTASGVLSGKTLTQITAGNGSACAIDSAGAAYCWGSDTTGQLGNNSTTQATVPVVVTASGVLSGKTLTQVAVGSAAACALDSTGAAYCWGSDSSGQPGNNSTTQATVPVAVTTSGCCPARPSPRSAPVPPTPAR
jgi:alpha-tubulin suppressor-like RCC1 family protein